MAKSRRKRSGLCPVRCNSRGRGQQSCPRLGPQELSDKTLVLLESWTTVLPSPKSFPWPCTLLLKTACSPFNLGISTAALPLAWPIPSLLSETLTARKGKNPAQAHLARNPPDWKQSGGAAKKTWSKDQT